MTSTESLETPNDNLGIAVDGCPAAPDGKHFPKISTIRCCILQEEGHEPLYVIDAICKYCYSQGSRCINPLSFNWD
jgi:hypothetical protein